MKFNILTTQPKIYDSFLNTGLIARGIDKNIININIHNLYDHGLGVHKAIDDTPYGGGAGMVLRVDIVDKAISNLKPHADQISKSKTILLTPQGKKFTQKIAKRLAEEKELILISGRFEGFDERIRDLVDEEISIGDYVLTSGDLPAMVLIDSISRQVPGFIDRKESIEKESFENNLLEYPQYTRPAEFIPRRIRLAHHKQARDKKGKKIPEILISGNHAKIAKWRQNEALKRTRKRRIDLIG